MAFFSKSRGFGVVQFLPLTKRGGVTQRGAQFPVGCAMAGNAIAGNAIAGNAIAGNAIAGNAIAGNARGPIATQ